MIGIGSNGEMKLWNVEDGVGYIQSFDQLIPAADTWRLRAASGVRLWTV
jgi:hypothetical protein